MTEQQVVATRQRTESPALVLAVGVVMLVFLSTPLMLVIEDPLVAGLTGALLVGVAALVRTSREARILRVIPALSGAVCLLFAVLVWLKL